MAQLSSACACKEFDRAAGRGVLSRTQFFQPANGSHPNARDVPLRGPHTNFSVTINNFFARLLLRRLLRFGGEASAPIWLSRGRV
jgi:hypothetical protein